MARQIDTIANRITLEGGAEILKFLDSLGDDGKAAAKKLQDAFQKSGFDKGVTQKIGTIRKSLLGLGGDARVAAASFNPLRSALAGVQSFIGGVASSAGLGILGAGGLGAALVALTSAAVRNAAAIKDQAKSFGISTDAIQKYQDLATSAGVPLDSLNGVLGTLSDKVDENAKKVKEASDTVEVFGGQTIKVVKGVQNFSDAVSVSGGKTIKVVRGAQDLNKELDKQSKLFAGITAEQFANGEAFDILAKRLDGVQDKFQAFRNEGLSKALANTFADLTNKAAELAKQAPKTGEAIGGLVKSLTPEEVEKLDKINDGFAQLGANLSKLFERGTVNNVSFLGGMLDFLNAKLVQFDRNAQEANKPLDGTKSALEVIIDKLSGRTSIGGTGLLSGIATDATAATKSLDDTKESLTGIKAVLMGEGTADTGNQGPQGRATAESSFFQPLIDAASTAVSDVTQTLSQIGQDVQITVPPSIFADLDLQAQKASERAAAELPGPFETAWARIESDASDALSNVKSLIDSIISSIKDAIEAAANLKASASDGSGSSGGGFGGGGGSGFAGGGPVWGPGSKTSDSILARLSRGEYVIKASAVDRYGPNLFHLLNSMRLPADFLRSLRGFNTGGLVDALERSFPIPRFATGGPVSAPAGGRSFVLQLPGGQKIQAGTISNSAVNELNRATTKARLLSAGRWPTYWDR